MHLDKDNSSSDLIIYVADYQSFHINCGGPDVTINNTMYEGDGIAGKGAILKYDSRPNWGFISAGDFMDDSRINAYIVSADPNTQPELYSKARGSPLFLTYYGYCLENGNYTVNLHFAEIFFRDEEPYYKVGRRIFDIYIQGILKWQDFNIKEQANGTGKAIIKTFNATVTENTLEIRLYWVGKGTTVIPMRGYYGPLISAISIVDPKLEDKFNKEEAERMIKVGLLCSNADPALRPTMSEAVADALRQIATTLGATLVDSTDDPCQSGKLSISTANSSTNVNSI
ncbi:hypothetical protein LWI29_022318 [Acer saccharum]|uniref:Malectin domain-containing protein n=1 Tax=Acer saccharum TaxID=4024 RepID=A0AA39RQZ6_ACESA|nr:hypothetical protein LWI29_022318 [Acer saccharum]